MIESEKVPRNCQLNYEFFLPWKVNYDIIYLFFSPSHAILIFSLFFSINLVCACHAMHQPLIGEDKNKNKTEQFNY